VQYVFVMTKDGLGKNQLKHPYQELTVAGLLCAMLFALTGCSRPAIYEPDRAPKPSPAAAANVRTSADVVRIDGSAATFPAGVTAELPIPISIEPGYHVNANPATFDYLIDTEVTADKSDGLTFGKAVYPAGEKKKFQFAEAPLSVYEGKIQIKLPVQAAANAAKGKRTVAVHVRVQACDQEKCFPPATLEAKPNVEVK